MLACNRLRFDQDIYKTFATVLRSLVYANDPVATPPHMARSTHGAESLVKAFRRCPLPICALEPAYRERDGTKKISVARLPITGSDVFGREEDIAFLDAAWANQNINVVTIVAWAAVGKSTLVNHWLGGMATDQYRSAQLVFGWSFYRQGSSGDASAADEFLEAALIWFGDPDPRIGTAWEKGE
jgi:hypothetical protein